MAPFDRIRFFSTLILIIIGLQVLNLITFRKFLKRFQLNRYLLNIFSIVIPIILNLPLLYAIFFRFDFTPLPKWIYNIYIIPFFIYQGASLLTGLYLLAGKIIKLPFVIFIFILKRFKFLKLKIANLRTKKAVVNYDKSRRAFITSSAILVSGYAFIGASVGVIRKDKFDITYQKIKIENLPEELKGTTITLFSDIHSGPYMDEYTMKEYTDAINSLNTDIIVIPGDFTNSQRNEIHTFNNAFKDLNAKYGIYGTLGNHDYFSDPNYIAEAVSNESPIKMLRNESEMLKINGKEICIIGVEDIRDSGKSRDSILIDYIDKTIENSSEEFKNFNDVPKILLCHKPYIFKEISDKKMDLVLSGHTHGGQIVFAKFGNINISIAASVSNYISGYYKEGDSQMYVSRGIGTVGLPIRLNCPPEITILTLV